MDQTFPTPGRSLHHRGTIRPISFGMRAAPTAAAEGWITPQGANHPIRSSESQRNGLHGNRTTVHDQETVGSPLPQPKQSEQIQKLP